MNERSTARHTIVLDGLDVIKYPGRDDVHSGLVPLYDYWHDECAAAVPLPKDLIDPVRLPAEILPRFVIIEVLREPLDFRYRLLGTNVIRFFGRDSTGKRFSEISYPQPHGDRLMNYLTMIVNENAVVYRETTADWANRDYLTIASMFLPGTGNGEHTDYIFGAVMSVK